ncbi:hypothetical protein CBR_g33953 [Chara braunii]|uniref:CCHC-type domain-containing protein n=1 Tax=Chara braunii TaxID=69332 RepID=A0A388LHQ3_CHABU|nr:hypothetical protein CBR_g33953 [Chara braunii]|eukprot:GBG81775.1 hypothetical protein CBR_g33953 [Chara braunii]
MASASQPSGNGDGEAPRRSQVCYKCKLPGHYARVCGLYWKERFESKTGGELSDGSGSRRNRGRSASPLRRRWEPSKRSPSADSKYHGHNERDSVKDLVSLLVAEREEKERAKREEEERTKQERKTLVKEEKRRKKEKRKKREQQENDERITRIVNMQFSRRWGEAKEEVGLDSSPEYRQERRRHRRASQRARKHRLYRHKSSSDNDVSEISNRTRGLRLTEKRKRAHGMTEEESQSSPVCMLLRQRRIAISDYHRKPSR